MLTDCLTLGYVAALPRLTELSLLYPHPPGTLSAKGGVPLDVVEAARSTVSELVDVCKGLPDFDTLQIVHFLPRLPPPSRVGGSSRGHGPPFIEQRRQELREVVNDLRDWAMDCLRKSKTGCREGEGGKRTTIRVVELSPYLPLDDVYHLDVLEAEDHEV